jgi:hypothetical protein
VRGESFPLIRIQPSFSSHDLRRGERTWVIHFLFLLLLSEWPARIPHAPSRRMVGGRRCCAATNPSRRFPRTGGALTRAANVARV